MLSIDPELLSSGDKFHVVVIVIPAQMSTPIEVIGGLGRTCRVTEEITVISGPTAATNPLTD